jgi:RNA polymerase sigma factor (sigma-70 family)
MQLRESKPISQQAYIAELYQRYWLMILSDVLHHVPSREDAEDVLLEVFLAALESDTIVTLGEKQQLAWLRRVAHNKCVDYHRRSARRPAVPLEATTEALYDDENLAPEQVALRQEEHALLRSRFLSLPVHQQEILLLRFADGLRCTEIASRMNKSEGAIRTLLSRSLNLLRSIYEKSKEETHHG